MTNDIQLLPCGRITPHVCYLALLILLLPGLLSAGQLCLDLCAIDPTCHDSEDGSIQVDVGGGNPPFRYSWSNGSQGGDLNNIGAGTYSVTVTDCDGKKGQATANLCSPDPMHLTLVYSDSPCSAPVDISALVEGGSPPYTYAWSNGHTESILMAPAPGNYTLIVTDSEGCEVSAKTSYPGATDLEVAAANIQYQCGDSSGSVQVVGLFGQPPYSFRWSNGDTSATATGLKPGALHMVTVTDAAGCTVSRDFPLIDFDAIDLELDISEPACAEDGPAIVVVKPPGDAAGYDYTWSDGTSGQSAVFYESGEYAVTVHDNQGCGGSKQMAIHVPAPLAVDITVEPDLCGAWDGGAAAAVSGGTSPYQFDWGNGVNAPVVSGFPLGNYTLTVRDTNGCEVSDQFSVNGPSVALTCQIQLEAPTSGPNTADGILEVLVDGGTAPYTYNWSDGQSTSRITDLSAGYYAVTITDANACFTVCDTDLRAQLVSKHTTQMAPIGIRVYPNPFERFIIVEIPGGINHGSAGLRLQTVFGQTLLEIPEMKPSDKLEIPVAELPPGAYIVRLQLGAEKEQVYRLIKN